ncbi:MAG TPA: protein jag [Eubacteriaceae bacterium]|nr:protein jag [Eubacteriaceae bacterium]
MEKTIATGVTIQDAIDNGLKELNAHRDNVEINVVEVPSKGIFGIGSKLAKVEITLKDNTEEVARNFLNDILNAMNVIAIINTNLEDNVLKIELEGKDMGVLIGRRGETLDAIQYLISLVINKGKEKYIRVLLDTEDYRARREKTLQRLAERLAKKVVKTRRKVLLEPMNPYERRIIHFHLQEHPRVHTYSEGEEPYRKVVISLKK